ncbi:hypothetical protein DCAR_0104958 [Daucus carota subsp. sativus]|uniref:Protein kinase domain-containing protein n=1 Tax=Daucus carota subsp. sativus TaxID=79200 RepID=A0AAF0WD02_DAUCS|nr:hypothetical protein DCAR_0104958 [Daucus carota subsp. sativus]
MGSKVVDLFLVILVLSITRVVAAKAKVAGDECRTKRCSRHGPGIRFPFHLKDRQPEHCGLPGFRVSCDGGETLLELQYLANTSLQGIQLFLSTGTTVDSINYKSQKIILSNFSFQPKINNVTLVSTSTSWTSAIVPPPFGGERSYTNINTTFASCSSGVVGQLDLLLTSLSGQAFQVYYFDGLVGFDQPSITSCTKVFNSSFPFYMLGGGTATLNWSAPNCGKCEAKGEYCKLTENSTSSNVGIADYSTVCHGSIKAIAGIIPGATLTVLVLVVLLYYIIRSYRRKKYDALKIEMFLRDYKAMKPTRYSYADIKKITRQFSNKLGQGGFGSVYKGHITKDIIVAVKILNNDPKANGEDFINEVGTIGRIYHVNVVRLVGYCADGCNRALVYEFQPNNSLEKFTYSGQNHKNNFLGWEKLQEIAIGIAKGIEYLHEGCAQQILHFDIKPHNILLDQNFTPKISDFGLAKLCSKDQSIVSMTMARGTIGYIAPEIFSRNFGKASSKSDIYSFGMLLLEMVGARNNTTVENSTETYFPEWIYHRLEEGGEVAIQIEKQEDSNIAKKLTIVGLWCIGWHPVDRPSIKHVIHMLERPECPAMPPNPFGPSNVRSFKSDLEVISESE